MRCRSGTRRPRRPSRQPVTARQAMRQRWPNIESRDAKTGTDHDFGKKCRTRDGRRFRESAPIDRGSGARRAKRPWECRPSRVVRRASPIETSTAGCPRAMAHRDPQAGVHGPRARRTSCPGAQCKDLGRGAPTLCRCPVYRSRRQQPRCFSPTRGASHPTARPGARPRTPRPRPATRAPASTGCAARAA